MDYKRRPERCAQPNSNGEGRLPASSMGGGQAPRPHRGVREAIDKDVSVEPALSPPAPSGAKRLVEGPRVELERGRRVRRRARRVNHGDVRRFEERAAPREIEQSTGSRDTLWPNEVQSVAARSGPRERIATRRSERR